ncbi:MAG: phosphate regulon sensor histidine kinase PhoR [Aquincola sp.]|nr:phosphate regulon sensor histidine kinase PhoR [Aquincola sp.]MDH4289175.1 phosphate regulon sensor histidine kinase PhoR [Aquincola sp.]MDH5330182.1 phosphate regulon sensor histidine kinase PhoR [Aquincola sp.]
MNPLLGRAQTAFFALLAGGLLGGWVGNMVRWPIIGTIAGALCGAGAAFAFDSLRAARLLEWLRGSQESAAPRDTGFWGEMGYRIERALRLRDVRIAREHARLQQFLLGIDASPNGVLLLDERGQIEWCNARAADHFGLDPVRDRAQRVTNLIRAPTFVHYLQGGLFDAPIEFASGAGRPMLSVHVQPYGEGMKLVLSQDITERERTDAMRRDFVANVSHEIRTPLTVLAGFVDTLASVPLSTAEQPRVLSLMREQTDRIQSLVDDLLTLAQLEGSPRPEPDRWITLDASLARVVADARLLSADRHRISVDAVPGSEVAGVETELVSAMANLLGNAVRYTPDEGRIDVRWHVRETDGCGVFEVRDSGIGIAREHLPRLTERFYRVDGSRSRQTGGTGLGLAIVKHVAQRHGGELEMESEPGKGSRFRLVLPAARVRMAPRTASTHA